MQFKQPGMTQGRQTEVFRKYVGKQLKQYVEFWQVEQPCGQY